MPLIHSKARITGTGSLHDWLAGAAWECGSPGALTAACGRALNDAMRAVEEYRISFRDAVLRATARRASCSALLSEDIHDGRRLDGVEIVDPFAPGAEARLEMLLEE